MYSCMYLITEFALLDYDAFNDYRAFSRRELPFLDDWQSTFHNAMERIAQDQQHANIGHESNLIFNEILEVIAHDL